MSFALSTATNHLAARHKTGAINATKRTSHRAVTNVTVRASDDGEKAQDSSAYRKAAPDDKKAGIFDKIVSNLPDGRRESAPESYGEKPFSRTLEEGRYRRPPPERVGGVTEEAVRGDDFELVDGPSFGVGTLVGLLVAAATLGGVYLTAGEGVHSCIHWSTRF